MLGGTSVWSEALSFELMSLLFNAKLDKTEMELEYWPNGSKITDYSIKVSNLEFGVSVTRAMKFRGIFTEKDVTDLLTKKLYGVTVSSQNVMGTHWEKQVLHIWTEKRYMCDVLVAAFEKLTDETLKSSTLVILTSCECAEWIFY